MSDVLTLALGPADVPQACVAWVVDRLQESPGLGVRTIVTADPIDALLGKKIDVALVDAFTAKTTTHSETIVAATLPRHPARDQVFAQQGVLHPTDANPFGVPSGARVGVSSRRQAGPLLACCEQTEIVVIDGAVGNPQESILDHGLHALILTEQQLEDLDSSQVDIISMPPEVLLPAPAHATFVLMAHANAPYLEILLGLDDPSTSRCSAAELELLNLVGPRWPALGYLAQETSDGAIRLLASLSYLEEDLRSATVTKVGAVTPDPLATARACFAAFEEIGMR